MQSSRPFSRLYHFFLSQFKSPQFLRYFIVGCSGVVLDLTTLYLLKTIVGLTPVVAVIINQIGMGAYIFLLNKYWVFGSSGTFTRQATRYIILTIVNYGIAIFWMWFFNGYLGFNYLLMRLANIALSTVWNFLLYRFFVYRK
ncbi:GtrA family protein [Patescibacteria group bacterium]|jgi:putative flippase GtrA|nr:GtrA family protein [Patescibacteria group bacterium]